MFSEFDDKEFSNLYDKVSSTIHDLENIEKLSQKDEPVIQKPAVKIEATDRFKLKEVCLFS